HRYMKFGTLILFVLALSSATAQTLFPRFGITGTTNSQKADYTDINSGAGFTAGAGYSQQITELFSVQLEINYMQKAFSSVYENSFSQNVGTDTYSVNEYIKSDYRLSYLEMPFLAKFTYKKLFITAGPYGAYGLGGSYKYERNTTSSYLGTTQESSSSNIKFGSKAHPTGNDFYFDNKLDIGFNAGLGIVLFEKLIMECRYARGSNLRDAGESRNHTLQLTAAWAFHLTN
ncbi:MAG TPA: porin family protein, partial [Cyclobacteriaceae bacterium]